MKLFVWDFHGVLEKGNEGAVLEISNRALADFGFSERFSIDDIHRLYGQVWYEYFKDLIPELPILKCKGLQERCHEIDLSGQDIIAKHIRPNDHAHYALDKISGKHDQILISNTTPTALEFFMNITRISSYFTSRAFAVDKFRTDGSKKSILNDFLVGKMYDHIITIGDSPGDVALTQVAGGTSYLYAHPGRQHRDCDADYKIHDLREILKEI